MSSHILDARMSREELLEEVMAAERETHDLLERAARLAGDPDERALFERRARREEQALCELEKEQRVLDAEAFVQRAIGC
jgi:hypothetical protein